MVKYIGTLLLLLVFLRPNCFAQQKNYRIHTVAFYNFENLFDTINDPATNDDEWTPKGAQHWTSKKYHQKLENLSKVLLEIGSAENTNSPTFIGCSEIENRGVLEDLIKQPKLIPKDYGIIHFDSPDKRGIDVALLYQRRLVLFNRAQLAAYVLVLLLVARLLILLLKLFAGNEAPDWKYLLPIVSSMLLWQLFVVLFGSPTRPKR